MHSVIPESWAAQFCAHSIVRFWVVPVALTLWVPMSRAFRDMGLQIFATKGNWFYRQGRGRLLIRLPPKLLQVMINVFPLNGIPFLICERPKERMFGAHGLGCRGEATNKLNYSLPVCVEVFGGSRE